MEKFQIKKTLYSNKTFRLPCDLIEALGRLAQHKQVSLNQLIIQCCEYALTHLDEEDLEIFNEPRV